MGDPIKLNPSLPMTNSSWPSGINLKGTSRGDSGMTAETVPPLTVKEIAAPTNPPHTWSADNPY